MTKSSYHGTSRRRRRTSRSRTAWREAAPFLMPKASQARERGSSEYCSKNPSPAIALSGALSLKKSGSPRRRTPKLPPHGFGCQKLTSSTCSWSDRKRNQSPSVVAT